MQAIKARALFPLDYNIQLGPGWVVTKHWHQLTKEETVASLMQVLSLDLNSAVLRLWLFGYYGELGDREGMVLQYRALERLIPMSPRLAMARAALG